MRISDWSSDVCSSDLKTREQGLLISHTGKGKGKTSAAPGMVGRAIGHGMKVSVVQFVKGAITTGEKAVFDAFPDNVEFKPMGEDFTWNTQDRARDIAVTRTAWDEVKRMIATPAMTRSEEHTSELQSLMRISYAVFCLKKQTMKEDINT